MMSGEGRNALVVGVDGSLASRQATMWAAREAVRRRAALELVIGYQVSVGFAGPGRVIPPDFIHVVETYAEEVISDCRNRIAGSFPELEVTTHVRPGHAAVVVCEAGRYALMTVVGSHGHSAVKEVLLGSVALKVAAGAGGPVVVVRGQEPTAGSEAGPVWVGIDGSAQSERAVAFAFEEASIRNAPLVAIHTWNDNSSENLFGHFEIERDAALFEEQRRLAAEQMSGWTQKYPDVAVRSLVLRGAPAATLLGHAQAPVPGAEPALIVVGSRGRGGFAGLLLGSVSQALITHAHCPVAVVKNDSPK